MTHSIEVEIDAIGNIYPVDPVAALSPGRAVPTWQTGVANETMLLSEAALAENWLGHEEDAAWAHLRRPSSLTTFPLPRLEQQ